MRGSTSRPKRRAPRRATMARSARFASGQWWLAKIGTARVPVLLVRRFALTWQVRDIYSCTLSHARPDESWQRLA